MIDKSSAVVENTAQTSLSDVNELVGTQAVRIGKQVWKTRNLTTNHYRNGDHIPQVTNANKWASLTSGAWCWYEMTVDFSTTMATMVSVGILRSTIQQVLSISPYPTTLAMSAGPITISKVGFLFAASRIGKTLKSWHSRRIIAHAWRPAIIS